MDAAVRLRGRSVVLDTNLVVLWCVGQRDPAQVARFKNTQRFDSTDVALLERTLAVAQTVLTLAHVFTESSNLLAQGAGSASRLDALARFAGDAQERIVPIADLVVHPDFSRLGAADAAILTLLTTAPRMALLTVDATLDDVAGRAGLNSVNFNHVRESERPDFR